MKKNNVILFGGLLFLVLFSLYGSQDVLAAGTTPNTEVNGDRVQTKLTARNQENYRFQQKTQVRINSSVNANVDITCDSGNIGNKEFELEVNGTKEFNMVMTCTEEEAELGLLLGKTVQNKSRFTYTYRTGFCIKVQTSEQVQAKLKLKAEEQYQTGTWAYFNETTEEWVPVATSLQNGYLVAETNHFSTWTVINLESDYTLLIVVVVIVVGIVAAVGIIFWTIKKR